MTGSSTDCSGSDRPNTGWSGVGGSGVGRTVALFPGTFRPPHINHYETVRRLAERPDVDEVIVIVSRRARDVPGTTLALDVDIAEQVWDIYLRDLDGVRVETAPTSAVASATAHVRAAEPGDRLLLVFGDPDLTAGRKRFGKALRCRPDGVSVSVERGAPNPRPVRATDMRALLAEGDVAFDAFRHGLPEHLNIAEQRQVWADCRAAMVDRHTLTMATLTEILERNELGPVRTIVAAGSPKADQVYRVTLEDRRLLFVKYANDAVNDTAVRAVEGADAGRKPRRRLKAEREALKWVRRNVESAIRVPTAVRHDRAARMLALTAVCNGGHRLGDRLPTAAADPQVVAAVTGFLAACNAAPAPSEPFWDEPDIDRHRWESALAGRTLKPSWCGRTTDIAKGLRRLAEDSSAAAGPGFCHLDYTPDNVLCRSGVVGVIDFESSSSYGDAAFDLGTQLGHYVAAGLGIHHADGGSSGWRAMIQAGVDGYRSVDDGRWLTMAARVAAFSGATALQAISERSGQPDARPPTAVLDVCAGLLTLGSEPDPEAVTAALVDCFDLGPGDVVPPVGPEQPAGKVVRHRSLQPLNRHGLWEGWLIDDDRGALTTVVVHGGRPRSTVDVHVDGVWVAASDLDSVGSAVATIPSGRRESRIVICDEGSSVLEGSVSPIRPGFD